MTEKRYYVDVDEAIIDSKTKREYSTWDISGVEDITDRLNQYADENEQLKKENHELKAILQDMGMLMSDEEIVNIRNEIADKFLKPLLKDKGFNVDVDTSNGFTIIPRGDVE